MMMIMIMTRRRRRRNGRGGDGGAECHHNKNKNSYDDNDNGDFRTSTATMMIMRLEGKIQHFTINTLSPVPHMLTQEHHRRWMQHRHWHSAQYMVLRGNPAVTSERVEITSKFSLYD